MLLSFQLIILITHQSTYAEIEFILVRGRTLNEMILLLRTKGKVGHSIGGSLPFQTHFRQPNGTACDVRNDFLK